MLLTKLLDGSNCNMIGFLAAVLTLSSIKSSNSFWVEACSIMDSGVVSTMCRAVCRRFRNRHPPPELFRALHLGDDDVAEDDADENVLALLFGAKSSRVIPGCGLGARPLPTDGFMNNPWACRASERKANPRGRMRGPRLIFLTRMLPSVLSRLSILGFCHTSLSLLDLVAPAC